MDYKTYEREMYLRHKKEEMEADLKRQYRKLESELKKTRNNNYDNIDYSKLKAYEVLAVVIIVVGAAHLLGLV